MSADRYSRQVLLPEIGPEGQERLGAASVLIVGAGGLGTPVAMYLTAAGVGRIGIVDFDTVEPSNLHRQPLYTDRDVGRLKVDVLAARLREMNPLVSIEAHAVRLDPQNALELIEAYDIVADGTDTFETRYLVNDACVLSNTPNAFASIHQYSGQASLFGVVDLNGGRGPCYRCLFPSPPPAGSVPSCADGGVLGVLPGLLGTVQATEVLKHLLGIGQTLDGRLLLADTRAMSFQTLRIERDPSCPVCGDAPSVTSITHLAAACDAPMPVPEITATDLHAMRQAGQNPFVLDVREADEYAGANIDGALIPLGELPERLGELEAHRDDDVLVVHCRLGGRSAQAVEYLRAHGFDNAVNLAGGIHAWSDTVDPSLPKV